MGGVLIMPDAIKNSENIIDSRDVIERIDELVQKREALVEAHDEWMEAVEGAVDVSDDYVTKVEGELDDAEEALNDWDEREEAEELKVLKALADAASKYADDWEYGETLIRDSYFKEYAMELAEDIGALHATPSWPYTCIDWEEAAIELQQDYTDVDFDGVTYWIR